jgi:hypothetical protein
MVILSGSHGNLDGRLFAEGNFLREDIRFSTLNGHANAIAKDVTRMSEAEYRLVLKSGEDVCVGYCWGQYSRALERAVTQTGVTTWPLQ